MLIAPFKVGLETDIEPWLAPPDSFSELNNIHIKDGFLQKREGYRLFGTVDNAERIMGLYRYMDADGTKTSLVFDALRANRYNSVTHAYAQLDADDIFSSGESDFVWSTSWQSGGGTNRLYFTNGIPGTPEAAPTIDGIRYFDSASPNVTTAIYPTLGGTGVTLRTMVGAKLLFTLGQRLIALNVDESINGAASTNHPQRARWCSKQNPGNWNDVVAGGGGYTDAATGDQIVSARALQNQIIVFFTNSVWSLTATSDPHRAFKWQKINNFRACDGKMSSIGYDRYVVAYGVRGITATDGVETRRIDERISNFTINKINVAQFEKVFCERSYANKRLWTLYNSIETTDNENDNALIYDDDSSAYSTYDISMNCLGYGNFSKDFALEDFTAANDLDLALNGCGDDDLLSYFWQDNQETLLGGDVNGNVFVMETDGDDNGESIDSTFVTVAWNPFKEEGAEAQMSYIDILVDTQLMTKGEIEFYKDTNTTPYATKQIDFLPNLNFISGIDGITNNNPVVGTPNLISINSSSHGLTINDIVYIYGVEGMTEVNSGETSDAYTVTVVDENNFTLNDIYGFLELTITNITNAATAVVKVSNFGNLANGDTIVIKDVTGMTEVNYDGTNEYTVANINLVDMTFELLGIDSTLYGAYTGVGTVNYDFFTPFTSGGGIYERQFYKTKTWKRIYAGGIGFQHRVGFTSNGTDKQFKVHALKPVFKKIGRRMVN
jgi:hypothetical protein